MFDIRYINSNSYLKLKINGRTNIMIAVQMLYIGKNKAMLVSTAAISALP
jgi:hypothetical protein